MSVGIRLMISLPTSLFEWLFMNFNLFKNLLDMPCSPTFVFRLLMSDLENLRHACARAQIFQVRQQDSKGIDHSMYRKTVLTHFEEKRQHPATYGWTYSFR